MSLATAATFAVAAWTLDEASGDRADSVGANTLTDAGTGTGSAAGMFGNAANFVRASTRALDSVVNPTDPAMGDIDFTIRMWVKLTTDPGTMIWMCKTGDVGGAASNIEYSLFSSGGTLTWRVSDGTTTHDVTRTTPSTGVWALVHVWHDSVANLIGISLNAGTAATTSHSTGVQVGTNRFWLGTEGAFDRFLDGLLDDVVILKNYVMSSADRTADYNGGTGVAFSAWAGGGSTFPESYSGSCTATGALTKAVSKGLAGSSTATGACGKMSSKPLAGSVTGVGALARATAKPLAGSMTGTGALAKASSKPLAGSATSAGSLAKAVSKPLAGSSTASGTLSAVRAVLRAFSGSCTAAGSVVKAVSRALAGSSTATGSLAKATGKPLAGSTTPTGTLARQAQKPLAGSSLSVGTLIRTIAKRLAGFVTGAGTLTTSGGSVPVVVPADIVDLTMTDSSTLALTFTDSSTIDLTFERDPQ